MADKAILNVAFSFGPIHLTVNRVTYPVSTECFALSLSKIMVEIASYDYTTFCVFSHYSVNVGVLTDHVFSNTPSLEYNINMLPVYMRIFKAFSLA